MAKGKKIDWLNHFLEFIVVVIGILLAFQLNTCSEDKKQGHLVEQHLQSIVSETHFNENLIKSSIKNNTRILGYVDTLLVTVDDAERLKREHFLAFKAMGIGIGYLKKNAYNTFVTTGDIRFVKDFELQNDIISLYEYYKWSDGISEMTRNTFTEYYLPYMVDNMDMAGAIIQPQDVYANKKFKNILSTYRYALTSLLNKQEENLTYVEGFLEKYDNTSE